jgi:hypothetical protein
MMIIAKFYFFLLWGLILMEDENARKLIINAVEKTRPTWSSWGVHWVDLDEVFLTRAYTQMGFDSWIFADRLQENNILSIDKIGRILDNGHFKRSYDREIASSLNSPLYILMSKGVFGEEGENFFKSIQDFDGGKGAAFWKLLWEMLVCCNYLKSNYKGSFVYYLKNKYAKYKNLVEISDEDFFSTSVNDWDDFKEVMKPWNELYGVGLNVFDYVMGDVEELEFVKNSYKLDSANIHFLKITGLCSSKDLDHEKVSSFLLELDLPYKLREVNKGLYAYCSETEANTYGFCRKISKCDECKVKDICEMNFNKI